MNGSRGIAMQRRAFMSFGRVPALLLAVALLLGGCAERSRVSEAEPGLNAANSALLMIYRPSQFFHAGNPEGPIVFINGEQIGSLLVGGVLQHRVKPGKYLVVLRKPVLFMPTYEIGRAELTVAEGKTYYLRHSYDWSGMVGVFHTGTNSFGQVDEAMGRQFR
jgi:hypothetical protein